MLSTVIGYIQATTPRIKEIDILSDGAIDGFTIVQLSDLHLTRHRPKEWLNNIVKMVNQVNADLIVITGDVADIELPDSDNILGALADLRSKIGIKLLQNENVIINHNQYKIMLAGVTDNAASSFGYPPPDISTAVKTNSQAHYRILLSHQPQNVKYASKHGIDLQLSGHTHAGQFFPWNIIVALSQEYFKGLYTVGKTTLYVNQGTGFWGIPIRLGSYSEITVIKIKNP